MLPETAHMIQRSSVAVHYPEEVNEQCRMLVGGMSGFASSPERGLIKVGVLDGWQRPWIETCVLYLAVLEGQGPRDQA